MPRSTHSTTRVAHRGPRHESDPDRRVKYALRYKRRGDEVTPETVVVRRHRRSRDRRVAPDQKQLLERLSHRRRRQETRVELEDAAAEFNTHGEVTAPVLPAA